MKIVIEGKNIQLTQALKDYVTDKLHKLGIHYEHVIKGHEVKVKLSVLKNPRITENNITEVTIFLDGKIVRSEQASEDMYASIDLVANKLDRQIQKYKDTHYRSLQHKEKAPLNIANMEELLPHTNGSELNKEEGKIIKSKRFKLHPMTPEDATLHLDLIEHNFYVFINSGTNQINTIYLRKDGNYGLIEPVV